METSGWFGVRCVFLARDGGSADYEERVTLWRASDADSAVRLAEAEAVTYAGDIGVDYLGLAQVYALADEPASGSEVFSLIRTSELRPAEYLDAFFDTGHERQGRIG